MISVLFSLSSCGMFFDLLSDKYPWGQIFVPESKTFQVYQLGSCFAGHELHALPSEGGASNAIKFTAKSEQDVKSFFKNFPGIPSNVYESVVSKLKTQSFKIQICQMSASYESSGFSISSMAGPLDAWPCIRDEVINGRLFKLQTWFIKCKREGNDYNIVFVPFKAAVRAFTFLARNDFRSSYGGKSVKFDVNRVRQTQYINEIKKRLDKGFVIKYAPYSVLINAENIGEIYSRLNMCVAAEREKFLKMPY